MDKQQVETLYSYLQSQQTARQFLHQCYKKSNIADAETRSYENANAFLLYLEHGRTFYKTGKNSGIMVQPLLYFYGMTHLLKACLLTRRPDYPESTSMLAHGVSARKRKKKNYTFLDDEIKIQQHGLFPYFAKHLFAVDRFPLEKAKMADLLALIPELAALFSLQDKDQEKMTAVGCTSSVHLAFPDRLLDSYHLTAKAFLQRVAGTLPDTAQVHQQRDIMRIELESPLVRSYGPFFVHGTCGKIYFPVHRTQFLCISEVMVHYLLLYNLSMLSRYETEWWGDLLTVKADADYPFISAFLTATANKVPLMLGQELLDATKTA